MAIAVADRVREQVSAFGGGTGNIPLPVVAVNGDQTFLSGWGASGSGYYGIAIGLQWEVGFNSINAGGTTLTRTDANVISGSSGAATRVNFNPGTLDVFGVAPASRLGKCTKQVFTSGSGTYTTPAGVTRLRVRIVGGGGGGSGSGTSPGNGGSGGDSTFSGGTGGGGGGGSTLFGAGSATASGGDINLPGAQGQSAVSAAAGINVTGGAGGSGALGGGGRAVASIGGAAGATNTGGGGGGGSTSSVSVAAGSGGASGAYCEMFIAPPSATYSYAVGAAGTAGTAGTNGSAGGAGGSGIIIVEEFYL